MDETKMEVVQLKESNENLDIEMDLQRASALVREVKIQNEKQSEVDKLGNVIIEKMKILSSIENEFKKLISEVRRDIQETTKMNLTLVNEMDEKLNLCQEKTLLIEKVMAELENAVEDL